MKFRSFLICAGLAFACGPDAAADGTRLFEPLPPVWRIVEEPVPEAPKQTKHLPIPYATHALLTRRVDNALGISADTLAQDLNSLDEVPDSAWFENRIGRRPLGAEDVFWGPLARDGSSAPAPGAALTVVSAKEEGANPGFIAEDPAGRRYVVKFDPPHRPEMQTGADVVGNRLFWALGYHVAEDSVFRFRREELQISPKATIGKGAKKRPLSAEDVDRVLALAAPDADGSYRCQLSRFVAGKPIGPLAQSGVRKGDPNDRIPHEDRRSMRAVKVFAAWINHADIHPGNIIDTYVTRDGRSFVLHTFIDFGEIFAGSAGESGDLRGGFEYRFDPPEMLRALLTFGFYVHPWERVVESGHRGIGPFGAEPFRYEGWKPALPNRYMNRANELDELWAVQKLLALAPEHIEAAVRAGQYSEPAAASYLAEVLEKRRRQIALEVLGRVNPACGFVLEDGGKTLVFEDLAVAKGLADAGQTAWRIQKLARTAAGERSVEAASETRQPRAAIGDVSLVEGEQLVVRIQTLRSGRELGDPVHVHLASAGGGLRVVGIDRWDTR